jgi:hypothetical protein
LILGHVVVCIDLLMTSAILPIFRLNTDRLDTDRVNTVRSPIHEHKHRNSRSSRKLPRLNRSRSRQRSRVHSIIRQFQWLPFFCSQKPPPQKIDEAEELELLKVNEKKRSDFSASWMIFIKNTVRQMRPASSDNRRSF